MKIVLCFIVHATLWLGVMLVGAFLLKLENPFALMCYGYIAGDIISNFAKIVLEKVEVYYDNI